MSLRMCCLVLLAHAGCDTGLIIRNDVVEQVARMPYEQRVGFAAPAEKNGRVVHLAAEDFERAAFRPEGPDRSRIFTRRFGSLATTGGLLLIAGSAVLGGGGGWFKAEEDGAQQLTDECRRRGLFCGGIADLGPPLGLMFVGATVASAGAFLIIFGTASAPRRVKSR
jgi:hypothetical protein